MTASFGSNVLLRLYRAAREMPPAGFPEYALGLIKPLLRFESAIWGFGLTMLLLCHFAQAQSTFTPPVASAGALEGVNFNGQLVGEKFRSRFSECDTQNTCDGKLLKYGCSGDRNRNSTLLKLKGGTVFYDGKMGLDADGSPYSQRTPGKTDQPQTSLRYPLPGMPSINSDRVPFIVIPLGGFDKALGVQVGDVGVVVYGAMRVYAVVADQGPTCKVGEGSIQLHEMLGHSVCKCVFRRT
jgi:hypothetical protein